MKEIPNRVINSGIVERETILEEHTRSQENDELTRVEGDRFGVFYGRGRAEKLKGMLKDGLLIRNC